MTESVASRARQAHAFDCQIWDLPFKGQYAVYTWMPEEVAVDTALVVVHGHGEHLGRYHDYLNRLADLSIPIIGYDHRGHGRSHGARGDAAGVDELIDDLSELLPRFLEQTSCARAIVYGHSMGGLVVASWLTEGIDPRIVRGAILSSPFFRVAPRFDTNLKIAIGRWIARFAPKLTLSTGLDASGISRDADQVNAYKTDPLVHNKISARLGKSLIDDPAVYIESAPNCVVPMLVYHGTADRIASIDGTRDFVGRVPKELVEFHELDGFYHEPHHEPGPEADRVYRLLRARISQWLSQDAGEREDSR